MSQTTATTTNTVEGMFRYQEPDLSVSADQRSFFSPPKPRTTWEERLLLHDYRTSSSLTKGPQGLDKHGFTLVEHQIDTSACADPDAIRQTYIPAVEQLVRNVTGCKTAVVNNITFRRKYPEEYEKNKEFFHPKGGDFDKMVESIPADVAMISPHEAEKSLEPARGVHVDYTRKGMLATVRHSLADMTAAEAKAIEAQDAGERLPRVAAFSVWRPLKTVTRDPLAVLDWRSPSSLQDRLQPVDYRTPGYKGEFVTEAYMILKPERPEDHEWYYVSEQKPHEVIMIKFADTESEYNHDIAAFCGHGSPFVVGTEEEEPRESIEARVLAFW